MRRSSRRICAVTAVDCKRIEQARGLPAACSHSVRPGRWRRTGRPGSGVSRAAEARDGLSYRCASDPSTIELISRLNRAARNCDGARRALARTGRRACARRKGLPIHVSAMTELDSALLASAFSYDQRERRNFCFTF